MLSSDEIKESIMKIIDSVLKQGFTVMVLIIIAFFFAWKDATQHQLITEDLKLVKAENQKIKTELEKQKLQQRVLLVETIEKNTAVMEKILVKLK